MSGTIIGQVVTGPHARPVAGAAVMLHGPPPAGGVLCLRTREDGAFVASRLAVGLWRLAVAGAAPQRVQVLARTATPVVLEVPTVNRDGHAPFAEPMPDSAMEPWPGDEPKDLQDGADGTLLDVASRGPAPAPPPGVACGQSRRPSRGSVIGWVLEAGSHQPAVGATISCHSSGGSAPDIAPMTDARGRFELEGLSEGLWIMRAHAEDGATGESVVAVRAGLRSQLVIELDAPGGPDALTGLL
jgi:hypothetical protein